LVPEHRQRVLECAAGVQCAKRFRCMPNADAPRSSVSQGVDYLTAVVRVIDNQIAESFIAEPKDQMLDQRFVSHIQQRFRSGVRQFPHSFATTCGQNHRSQPILSEAQAASRAKIGPMDGLDQSLDARVLARAAPEHRL